MTTLPSTPNGCRPRHVAIIMDGNGRWAAARGLSRTAGHRAGTENIRSLIQAFGERGVSWLTLFAFSTENWNRPRREVAGLMTLLTRTIRKEVQPLHKAEVRLHYIGRLDVLNDRLRRQIEEAVALTRHNDKMTVCVAFNYGGRSELVDAVKRIVAAGLPAEAIDEATIAQHLYTAGLPDPDLIIRTGGEMRLSNFLLWQAAYAEYHTTPTYWPDFATADIEEALAAYAGRVRKYGALPPAPGGDSRTSGSGDSGNGGATTQSPAGARSGNGR